MAPPNEQDSNSNFVIATDLLLTEMVGLDSALQKTGSAGLRPAIRADTFRKHLRKLKSLSIRVQSVQPEDVNRKKAFTDFQSELNILPKSSAEMFTELREFAGRSSDSINELFKQFLALQARISTEVRLFLRKSFSYEVVNDENWKSWLRRLASVFEDMQPVLQNMIYEITRTVQIQSVENQKFVNLTVIATFLSGVTASVLQIVESNTGSDSSPNTGSNSSPNESGLNVAVSTCLFSSLVVSTASAGQSLLAISWIQTIVYQASSDDLNKPRPFALLLRHGPLWTLLIAGALFTLGIVLYMFSSHQHHVVSAVTTGFAGILSLVISTLALILYWNHQKVTQQQENVFNFYVESPSQSDT